MENSKKIIEFTKDILANIRDIGDIDDLIDKSLEPIKDYTDTIGDIVKPIKTITSIVSLRRKIALKSFIKNYANSLTKDFHIDPKETEKLNSYFSKPKNVQFVAQIIENGILAKSVKCSAILGVIAGDVLKTRKELNDKDLVIIASLKEMTDIDLNNFIELVENIQLVFAEDLWNKKTYFETEFHTFTIYGTDGWRPIKVERLSLELTIEKLKRTGALTSGSGGIGSHGNVVGSFMFYEFTKELYEQIKKTRIE